MAEPLDVEQLVEAARAGDGAAWDALVDRYLPLVTAVIRRLRLSAADADDVNQTVWLRLVEHLDRLREPRALPGWLATTARHEGLRLIKRKERDRPVDPGGGTFERGENADLGEVLVQDLRSQALRDALLELPEKRRALLLLLLADPPLSYDDISARLGIPRAASVRPGHGPWNSCARHGRSAAGHPTSPLDEEVVAMSSSTDDEGLMVELARAMEQEADVPHHRREAARAAFIWRTVDEDLLALTHDSLEVADAAVRGVLDVRTLGFRSDGLSLELEVDGDRVFGQVLDAEVDQVVVESAGHGTQDVAVDTSGIFSVVVAAGQVRFGVLFDGALRRTPWIVLVPGPLD